MQAARGGSRPKRHRGLPHQSSPQEIARGQSPGRDSMCGGRCQSPPGTPAAMSAGLARAALPGAVGALSPDGASQPPEGGRPASSRRRPSSSRKIVQSGRDAPEQASSFVLVAKTLTKSDTGGRVILPRVSVESNLRFLIGFRSYGLPVRDREGRLWEFVVKSWANGTEHRRVYVLEHAAEYIASKRLREGDVVGICADVQGALVVEANTPAVRSAVIRPMYGVMPAALQILPPDASGAAPLISGEPGRCTRNSSCSKPAGHPGFCSGPRAPQPDAAQRSSRGSPRSSARAGSEGSPQRPSRSSQRLQHAPPRYAQSCEAPDERRDASSAGQQPGSQQPVQPASAAQPVLETAALMQRPSASSAAALRVPACEVPAARDQLPAGPNLLPCQKDEDLGAGGRLHAPVQEERKEGKGRLDPAMAIKAETIGPQDRLPVVHTKDKGAPTLSPIATSPRPASPEERPAHWPMTAARQARTPSPQKAGRKRPWASLHSTFLTTSDDPGNDNAGKAPSDEPEQTGDVDGMAAQALMRLHTDASGNWETLVQPSHQPPPVPQDLIHQPRHLGRARMGWEPARSRMLLKHADLPAAQHQHKNTLSRHRRVQPGTAEWAQLCPGAQDEAAAVAREASQLAENAAELAAAQVRRALGSGDPVRRRLSSEHACNISRMGSCQLSNIEEHPCPPDILLNLADPELPGGSEDAYSGPRASCNVTASHSEEQLTEVTSPRKEQPLCTELSPRQYELTNLLSRRRGFLVQEGCLPDIGTYTATPALNHLPSERQISETTHTALAGTRIAVSQGGVQVPKQQAGPSTADLRKPPEQHASATDSERSRQAPTKAEQIPDGISDMASHTRVLDTKIRSLGAPGRLDAQHENQALVQTPFLGPDLANPRPSQQQSQPHISMQFPWPEREQGYQAMCSAPSMQQPELPVDSGVVQRKQRAIESHGAQAEGAEHSFGSRIEKVPDAQATGISRPPIKQETPQSALAATQAGLAMRAQATTVPLSDQQPETGCSLATDREERPLPAAHRPLHVVPHRTVGMPALMARPRSACSPVAAAMQYPLDSSPPPAWGNTF